jgi:hypothetical protein
MTSLICNTKLNLARIKGLLGVCLVLGLTACSQDRENQKHAAALEPTRPPAALGAGERWRSQSSSDIAIVTFNNDLDLNAVRAELQRATNENDPSAKTTALETVADRILRREIFQQPASRNDDFISLLHAFNTQLVTSHTFANVRTRASSLMARYQEIIFDGCSQTLSGCRNVDLFNRVGNTKDVLLMDLLTNHMDQCVGLNDGSFNRKLQMGYALVSRGVDEPRLDAVFLNCAFDRLTTFRQAPAGRASDRELQALVVDIERVLSRTGRSAMLRTALERFNTALKPAEFNDASHSSNRVDLAIHNLRRKLLQENPRIINDPEFLRAVDLANRQGGDAYNYSTAMEFLKREGGDVMLNLGLREITERDSLFVLVESVALRRYSPQMALAFFQALPGANANATKERLGFVFKAYSQALFLNELVKTNSEMARFYKTNEATTAEVIQDAIEKSQSMQGGWLNIYARVSLLREFASSSLQISGSKLGDIGLDVQALMVSSVYMVSIPHMMMLAYTLADKRFSITIRGFFGTFTINYMDVIEWVFEGDYLPWFIYAPGADNHRYSYVLNRFQVVHALYFALRTGTFKVFNISEEEFLKKTIDTLVQGQIALMKDGIDSRTTALTTFSQEWNMARRACSEELKRDEAKARGENYTPAHSPQIDFQSLGDGLLTQTRWFRAVTGREVVQKTRRSPLLSFDDISLSVTDAYNTERLDMTRLSTGQLISNIEAILKVYEQFVRDTNRSGTLTESQIQEKVRAVSGGFEQLKHDRRVFLTLVDQLAEQMTKKCALRLALRENELYNEVHWQEVEHLKSVYRDKKKLVAGEATYPELAQKYKFSGYESLNYTGRDDFSGNTYRYTMMDAHMRVQRHLDKVAPNIRIVMPAPERMRDLDAFTKTQRVESVPFFNVDGSWVSEEDFVRAALSFGGELETRGARAFFLWETRFSLPSEALERLNVWHIHALAILYKFGEVELYPADNPLCLSSVPQPADVCPVRKKKFVQAPDLVNEHLNLLNLVSVKKEEEELYSLRNMPAKLWLNLTFGTVSGTGRFTYDPTTNGSLVNPLTGSPQAFFDLPYAFLNSKMLGMLAKLPWTPESMDDRNQRQPFRLPTQELLRKYYHAQNRLETLPFQVDEVTNQKVNTIYRQIYAQDVAFTKDFENEVRRLEEQDLATRLQRSFRRSLYEDPILGPYLTSRYVDDFINGERQFHAETKNFFAPAAAATTR